MRRQRRIPLLFVVLLLLLPSALLAQQAVDARFRDYYVRYAGARVLGPPISGLEQVAGIPAQYFEKARLEDHTGLVGSQEWRFLFGRLTAELIDLAPHASVSSTALRYTDLAQAQRPEGRVAPPAGFGGGTVAVSGGRFVPYDSQLRPAPGYIVTDSFWNYINRTDLFPGGWLHDVGLPMSGALQTTVVKGGQERAITIQAFERTVLTFDPQNPPDWRIERANLGLDVLAARNAPPSGGLIGLPAANARVTLPLHIEARVGQPGQPLLAVLRWQDGTTLTHPVQVLRGPDGNGLVIDSIDWQTESQPPQPPSQPAELTLQSSAGAVLARQPLNLLSASDPGTTNVDVYLLLGEELRAQQRRIVSTPSIGAAALDELLWGPAPRNFAGFTTALPSPAEVLGYAGRGPEWGARVRLLGLTISDGVATANFSRELRAYGGGSARVQQIRSQITRTLQQFASVREVRIAIEGQTEGVLQP